MLSMPRYRLPCSPRVLEPVEEEKVEDGGSACDRVARKPAFITNARSILISSTPFTFDSLFGSLYLWLSISRKRERERERETRRELKRREILREDETGEMDPEELFIQSNVKRC
mgnify:CR=1 FL=1